MIVNVIRFGVLLGLSITAMASSISLTIQNPLSRERSHAPVEVSRDRLNLQAGATVQEVLITQNGHPWTRPFQLDDRDGDGQWDALFFLVNLQANESASVLLEVGTDSSPKTTQARVYADIRNGDKIDRLILESELMLYNMYGSTQIDCIGKLFPRLTGQEWYAKNGNQHKFSERNGHDYLHVGHTMGAHSSFIADGLNIYRPWTQRAFFLEGELPLNTEIKSEVVINGPLRVAIKTTVNNLKTPKGNMSYELIQSINSMQRHIDVNVTLGPEMKENQFHYGAGFRHFYEDQWSIITPDYVSRVAFDVWESGSLERRVARAILTPFNPASARVAPSEPALEFAPENGPNTVVEFASQAAEIRYAFVSAWEKDGGIQSVQQWEDYLKQTSEELKNPVIIEFK